MTGDRLEDIQRALGRVEAGVEASQRREDRLEEMIVTGLRDLKSSVQEMLLDMRQRYHDRQNEAFKQLLTIDQDLVDIRKSIDAIDGRVGTVEGRVIAVEGRIDRDELRGRINWKWIVAITTAIWAVIGLAVEWFRGR